VGASGSCVGGGNGDGDKTEDGSNCAEMPFDGKDLQLRKDL
jgi:hypothetical protein